LSSRASLADPQGQASVHWSAVSASAKPVCLPVSKIQHGADAADGKERRSGLPESLASGYVDRDTWIAFAELGMV
jgi:hypothetical protein